jgi:anti-sigma regulatory factor (Ser/Thr protein kinase)
MAEPSGNELRLEVTSDPRLLGFIRAALRLWLEVCGLIPERRDEVVLAVDEACANCIRHAYQGRDDGRVELVLSTSGDWLEITVNDEGTPCPTEFAEFRPLERPCPDTVSPGGLGIKLIHEVFDEVRFCPGQERGNCVTMRLRTTTASEADGED